MRMLLLLVLSLCLVSCKKEGKIIVSNDTKMFVQFPKDEKIEFKNLVEFIYGNPRKIIINDSILILGNRASGQEHYLYNYSLRTNKFSKPYVSKGRGPGEIMGMATIGTYKDHLWINDFTGKKMMLLDKSKAISEASALDYKEYSFKNNRFFDIKLIDNLQCIATGSETSKSKIQILDLTTGEIVKEFGKLKSYSEGFPLHVITKASLTQSYLRPASDKLVLAYFHTDIVEVFDLKTGKNAALQGPEKFDVDFTVHNNHWLENDNTRVTFIGGAVTNDNIYLLYSGKKFNEENAFRGSYVFVYDWNLNPVKKITLDKEVYQICISEDNKTLYSYDEITGYILNADLF